MFGLMIAEMARQAIAEVKREAEALAAMAELYAEEAFSAGMTDEAADAMLEDMAADLAPSPLDEAAEEVEAAYDARAAAADAVSAYTKRKEKVEFESCVARDEYKLEGFTTSTNSDGFPVICFITTGSSGCNCDDTTYNPGTVCKHRAALASRWLSR